MQRVQMSPWNIKAFCFYIDLKMSRLGGRYQTLHKKCSMNVFADKL